MLAHGNPCVHPIACTKHVDTLCFGYVLQFNGPIRFQVPKCYTLLVFRQFTV